jgi:hypothetical protein
MSNLTVGSETIVMTIGHSTRTLEDFISLLKESGIDLPVDIRTIPLSHPWSLHVFIVIPSKLLSKIFPVDHVRHRINGCFGIKLPIQPRSKQIFLT